MVNRRRPRPSQWMKTTVEYERRPRFTHDFRFTIYHLPFTIYQQSRKHECDRGSRAGLRRGRLVSVARSGPLETAARSPSYSEYRDRKQDRSYAEVYLPE